MVAHEEAVMEQSDERMAGLMPCGTDEEDRWVVSHPDVEDVWVRPPQRKLQMQS